MFNIHYKRHGTQNNARYPQFSLFQDVAGTGMVFILKLCLARSTTFVYSLSLIRGLGYPNPILLTLNKASLFTEVLEL